MKSIQINKGIIFGLKRNSRFQNDFALKWVSNVHIFSTGLMSTHQEPQ